MYSHVYSTISCTPYYLPKTFWPAPIADYEKGTAAEEAFRPEKTRWEVASSRRLGTTSSIVTSDFFLGFVWPSVTRVQGFNGEFSQELQDLQCKFGSRNSTLPFAAHPIGSAGILPSSRGDGMAFATSKQDKTRWVWWFNSAMYGIFLY